MLISVSPVIELYIEIYTDRGLVGIGAGLGICVGPIYLSEIAPSKIRGSVGTSNLIFNFNFRVLAACQPFERRSLNAAIDRARYHAHTSYGSLSCDSAAMAICLLHFVGGVYRSIMLHPLHCRISVVSRQKELSRRSKICYAKVVGKCSKPQQ